MRRLVLFVSVLSAPMLGACSRGATGEPATRQASSPIIHGEPDQEHDAVVALLGPQHSCSGTIVAIRPPYLYVLTAAHCVAPVAPSDPVVVAMGQETTSPDASFSIESCQPHPDYDGEIFDFAMCRAVGADAATPFIAVQSEPDQLVAGTWVRHVGYGVTDLEGSGSSRNSVPGQLSELDDWRLWYEQPEAGPCFGDSGGPQLTTEGPERVVGVTSFGDQECNIFGASGRASVVLESFVMPYVESGLGGGGAGGATAPGEDEPPETGPKGDGAGSGYEARADLGPTRQSACSFATGPAHGGRMQPWLCTLGIGLGLVARAARRQIYAAAGVRARSRATSRRD